VTAERELSVAAAESLERDGYLLVPSLLDEDIVYEARAQLAVVVAQEVAAGHGNHGNPGTVEAGVVHLKLDPADPAYRPFCEHRLLAEAATAVLGTPWHVTGLNLRAPLPGCGHQGLHPDYGNRRITGPWQILSAMWCISSFTRDNGPLRVIPGSHRVSGEPVSALAPGCEMGPHPDEFRIIAAAGSVILFNSADLWHSGTFNYSPAPRLAITVGFGPGAPPNPSPDAA
jgi:ectoine hydroxylase-related dioxygenase (phytanoyl-CoA dioxygenase family)